MCTLYKRSSKFNRIDSQQLQKREHEELYWRTVLKRIISTIKFLSRLGVAFRGHDEGQKSTRTGNYLKCLDYLSEYDDFLKLNLQKYANRGRGNVSYLSHQICDEFISITGKQVKAHIINEIKNAKYYSIVLDSTPSTKLVTKLFTCKICLI
ncbi:TTF-type domain-containing protein [Trichonephila clavata]|uniref:TTF-type domain-containing protein n=1 Tax=Trichonephila clavata TaxID=2740835 RepID=A0A8X6GNQ6_TRICU|nr:TTF-type domain-containing protein [Trichonephila clavata]